MGRKSSKLSVSDRCVIMDNYFEESTVACTGHHNDDRFLCADIIAYAVWFYYNSQQPCTIITDLYQFYVQMQNEKKKTHSTPSMYIYINCDANEIFGALSECVMDRTQFMNLVSVYMSTCNVKYLQWTPTPRIGESDSFETIQADDNIAHAFDFDFVDDNEPFLDFDDVSDIEYCDRIEGETPFKFRDIYSHLAMISGAAIVALTYGLKIKASKRGKLGFNTSIL